MEQNKISESAGSVVMAAVTALAILAIDVVDRCPTADCPLCGSALPIAA